MLNTTVLSQILFANKVREIESGDKFIEKSVKPKLENCLSLKNQKAKIG